METVDIDALYRELWKADTETRKFAHDQVLPASIRAIASYLSAEYDRCLDLYAQHSMNSPKDEAPLWKEVQLMLDYHKGKPLVELQQEAEDLLLVKQHSIFATILLATSYVRQNKYRDAIAIYHSVLQDNPEALILWVNLMVIYLLTRQTQQACEVFRRGQRVVSHLRTWRRRIYWRLAFYIYSFRIYPIRSMLLGITLFLIGAFPPIVSHVIGGIAIGGIAFLIGIFQFRRDHVARSIVIRLLLAVILAWVIGYGARALFLCLERL